MFRSLTLTLTLTLTLLGCKSEPAPEPQPQPDPVAPDAPNVPAPTSDVFSLRFKNWTDAEVDDVIQGLEKKPDFSNWNHRGQTGVYSVYEVRYTGNRLAAAVREAFEDAGLNNRAEITLSGNDLNVIKTGR